MCLRDRGIGTLQHPHDAFPVISLYDGDYNQSLRDEGISSRLMSSPISMTFIANRNTLDRGNFYHSQATSCPSESFPSRLFIHVPMHQFL